MLAQIYQNLKSFTIYRCFNDNILEVLNPFIEADNRSNQKCTTKNLGAYIIYNNDTNDSGMEIFLCDLDDTICNEHSFKNDKY